MVIEALERLSQKLRREGEAAVGVAAGGVLGGDGGEGRLGRLREAGVVAGTGTVQPAGSDRAYRNAGNGLVALLVLSVAPEAA